MAGVREGQKLAREQRILTEAAELFTSRGYAATGIEQIAGAAGLAVGTIYNYFPSKAEILLAILRRDTQTTLAGVERILKHPLDPTEAMARLCDVYLNLIGRHDRRLWRELLAAALANPDTIAPGALQEDLRLLAQIVTVIEELQTRGLLDPGVDPGRAAMAVSGVYVNWFLLYLASDDVPPDLVRREVRAGVDIVMKGLLA